MAKPVQLSVLHLDHDLLQRCVRALKERERTVVVMSFYDEQTGAEQLRLRNIPVHTEAGSVVYQESITFAKAMPTSKIIVRMVAVDEAGGEHLLGE